MDARRRRQPALLLVLVAVFAATVAYQFWPEGEKSAAQGTARAPQPAAQATPAARPGARRSADGDTRQVVDVGVGKLQEAPPEVESEGRNPFRFKPKAPPPPPPSAQPPVTDAPPAEPPEPPGPPPPPPITLKFIGILTGQERTGRVAILSDGKFVYYGREGDIIEGRYRLVKIGEESVQMEHVDGRGRQTIRLSGA